MSHRIIRRGPAAIYKGSRRGAALIWVMTAFVGMIGLISLAVDYGHVQVAKRQLQDAADAAALAGAGSLSDGVSVTQSAVSDNAGRNNCDGTAVAVDVNTEIDFLDYNAATRTSTVLTGSARSTANAICVKLSRTGAKGNPVSLSFARLIGISACDIHAAATAYSAKASAGYIGLSLTRMYNTAHFDGYNSAAGAYSTSSAMPGNLLSIKDMWLYDTSSINGEAHWDLSGTLNRDATTSITPGPITQQNLRTSYPAVTLGNVATVNDNAKITQYLSGTNFNVPKSKGTVTFPGGTFYFTQLTVSSGSTVYFSSPTVIYLNGSGAIQGTIAASSLRPADLSVRVAGGNAVKIDPGVIYGCIYNPTGDVHHHNGGISYGSVISDLLCFRQNSQGHEDLSLGKYATPTGTVALTK